MNKSEHVGQGKRGGRLRSLRAETAYPRVPLDVAPPVWENLGAIRRGKLPCRAVAGEGGRLPGYVLV